MEGATDVSEENLTWKWTTGDDPATGPPWSVRFASTWTATEGAPEFLGVVKDSANEIELYLDFAAKTGRRPDFSGLPVSALFARVFDLGKLAALPPPKGSDVPLLLAWISSANGVAKAIMYFGITPPPDPIADQDAIKRNLKEFSHPHHGARGAIGVFVYGRSSAGTAHTGPRKGLRQGACRRRGNGLWRPGGNDAGVQPRECAPH
jgi:hypothetical protein